MDVRQLRYFVRIVEMESISAAAKALFVAQPSLSQHVANLERELGTPLLIRGAHGISTTPQGDKLYHSARSILRQVDDTVSSIRCNHSAPAGTVSVGLPTSTNRRVGLELVRSVGRLFPDVMLNIVDGVTSHLTALTDKQLLDVAVLTDVRQAAAFQSEALIEEDLLFVSCTPPFGGSLADCAAQPLVLPSYPNSVRVRLESACLERGLATRVVVESASAELMLDVVRSGIAATFLPWAALSLEAERDCRLFIGVISDFPLTRHLSLCVSRAAQTNAACMAVHDMLRAILVDQVGTGDWRNARLLPGTANR